ncbi:MAG: GNAT family N-acetyltransferase [Kiritimatiellaeota bacterium]|nr:GNAT family N-acetyltransferase [Kiritimatiellota bacterium]
MAEWTIRRMTPADRREVAGLICLSTNYWYEVNRGMRIFPGGPDGTTFHFDVYHALPGSYGLVAEHPATGELGGSCFVHVRPTHVSLGIMNVHPNYFGQGIARRLLGSITAEADRLGKPVRLVSSAMNLDSFSLYTKAGFTPHAAFQDMMFQVPAAGLPDATPAGARVRQARLDDLMKIETLEWDVSGIRRNQDWEYFIEDRDGVWHVSVCESADNGAIEGCLASCAHPAVNMIGPGVMRTAEAAVALLAAELDRRRGQSPVFLLPVEQQAVVRQAYAWGARNCETHFAQTRGAYKPFQGIVMPTFMPETG